MNGGEIGNQVRAGINETDGKRSQKDCDANLAG